MIELTRVLARSFRAVLRHSLAGRTPRPHWPPVLCRAGDGGLTLQAVQTETALRRHQTDPRPADRIAFRADILARFEGRTEAPVSLENVAAGKGRARWDDGGAPCALDFDTVPPDGLPPLSDPPAKWTPMPAEFLRALDEASRTAARESVRYALGRIQLRGRRGEAVGTDGGQLLVQAGFPFPWAEDLLVPRLSAFGRRELAGHAEVRVGRARNHVAVAAGPWTLLLAVDATGRYPDAQSVIPRRPAVPSRLVIDEEDALFLTSALPRLPGRDDFNAPVTLDLGRPPAVRARAEGSDRVVETPLARSAVSGPAVRLCTSRRLLHRMLTLGFRELWVASPDAPLLCRDARRTFLLMPLDKKAAVPPGADVFRIGPGASLAATPSVRPRDKEIIPMPPPPPNGRPPQDDRVRDPRVEKRDLEDAVAEAEALRGLLQDASARAGRLLAALRHQRRHSRAVKAAMQSLQQLRLGP